MRSFKSIRGLFVKEIIETFESKRDPQGKKKKSHWYQSTSTTTVLYNLDPYELRTVLFHNYDIGNMAKREFHTVSQKCTQTKIDHEMEIIQHRQRVLVVLLPRMVQITSAHSCYEDTVSSSMEVIQSAEYMI